MDMDKVRNEITQLVEDILEKKALAGLEADVEDALRAAEKTVLDLTATVAEMQSKMALDAATAETLEASKAELETELAANKETLQSLQTEREVLLQRVEVAETTLEKMEKDKLARERMAELDELKIARAEEAREAQELCVSEMSDEQFAAYKEEMVALRSEIVNSVKAELEAAAAPVAPASEEVDDGAEGGVHTPPVNVEGALETASAVLPNAEGDSTESKWKKFGPLLALYMRGNHDEASKDNK